ncbi:Transposon protein [Arachis hypogaea]|nr:Transposon protein [Arachis hypogaea]
MQLRRFFQMSITDSVFGICGRTSIRNGRISSLEGYFGIVQGVLAKMASLISSKRLKGLIRKSGSI